VKSIINYIVIITSVLLALPTLVCAEDYMYWEDFAKIELPNITSRGQTQQSSATVTLYLSGDAQITADDTIAAQLSCTTDTLITEYKLTFDSTGGSTGVGTGGDGGTEWQSYDTFLKTGTEGNVDYVADDNSVQVTLWVKASNDANGVADSDEYDAIQTLTVSWGWPE